MRITYITAGAGGMYCGSCIRDTALAAALMASGHATIGVPSDLEVPITIIPELLKEWEGGANIVFAVQENRGRGLTSTLKTMYMKTLRNMSDIDLVINTSGYGLIDRKTQESLKQFNVAMPYHRGLLSEIGGITRIVKYQRNTRTKGKSKNNWSQLYDYGMIGLVSHTRFPLKVITILGFLLALFSALLGLGYLIAKICYWNSFETGIAPVVIGVMFLSSLNLCFLGLLGEYIYQIYLNSRRAPLVFEDERLNF